MACFLQKLLVAFKRPALAIVLMPAQTPAIEPDVSPATIDYLREVAPIFKARCLECHGKTSQESGLRLDRHDRAMLGGDNGRVIMPNDATNSELIRRITSVDTDKRMPPETSPLKAEDINLLVQWIDQGATGSSDSSGEPLQHWAFQPIRRPAVPEVHDDHWVQNPIDHFVLDSLEQRGITPSPVAVRTTLIRRLYLDLLGLPPEWNRVQQFIQDDCPDAWERLVDELLASPHYGERWGRHWLDLARYADSSGYEADTPREIWPYRDWVINALNRDIPFDQFVVEQIAGDLLHNATSDQRIATGFHCNAMLDPGVRWESIVERVNTTGTVFLGLTLGCAQCHSHKTDPVSHREYYQLYAFFNEASITSFERPEVDGIQAGPQISLVMKQSPQSTHIFRRGDPAQPGQPVQPAVPAAFNWAPALTHSDHQTRHDLAKWLTSPKNPLTARVTVNRIWQRYFGLGLVDTENDFGTQTPSPSHPKLLDWLALDFQASGWTLKRLHRLIATSQTYRQSSQVRADLTELDPHNRWLARQCRLRLEAEIIRDVTLSSSGLLSRKIGGPSVFPPQPDGILDNRATPATWTVSRGEDQYRRGMYTWIWRLTPHPHSTVFNGPDNVTACTRRDRSNVSVQALTLLNDPSFLQCAQYLGHHCSQNNGQDDPLTVRALFATCLSRRPSRKELMILLRLLNAQRTELLPVEARGITGRNTGDLIDEAAWVVICRAIMNTDEFITRE